MATLFVTGGTDVGRCCRLGGSRLVSIGRDDQCSFQILDDHVSRRHLQIRRHAERGGHWAVDMRSANGVFVNGDRLVEDRLLADGDLIQIGGTSLRYTKQDFPDDQTAIVHYKKTDEWKKDTAFQSGFGPSGSP